MLSVEVDGLDHQRLSLPTATGVTHPLPNRGSDMRPPVERDDTHVVVLLVEDGHMVRRLKYLDVVVVATDADGWAGLGVLDTAVTRIEILVCRGMAFSLVSNS